MDPDRSIANLLDPVTFAMFVQRIANFPAVIIQQMYEEYWLGMVDARNRALHAYLLNLELRIQEFSLMVFPPRRRYGPGF